ncbi:MAG: hypothetical protein M1441_01875 [Candidatus Parvarchaeota archaeon]|nr:hypothetical protein [Candidatus Parvarchaeota archaeon]
MDRLGQNKGMIFLILLVVAIIIVIIAYHGIGNIASSHPASKPGVFTVSAVSPSGQILKGHSSAILLDFYNPFSQTLTANVSLSLGEPAYVSTSTPYRSIYMPASMPSSSSSSFNVTCLTNSGQSTYIFSVAVPSFWDNFTTSVVTYPYGTASKLIPVSIYNNSMQGFIPIIANPISIETQLPSTVPESNINIVFSNSTYAGGAPYTEITSGTPNDDISSIYVSISNTSSNGGIASAFIFYNGQKVDFTPSPGGLLTAQINNVYMPLLASGLPIEITARNITATTQDLVNIAVKYNYLFYVQGSPNIIDCG